MLTKKLLGVTIPIDDERARVGNQTVRDDDFLAEIVGRPSEKVE